MTNKNTSSFIYKDFLDLQEFTSQIVLACSKAMDFRHRPIMHNCSSVKDILCTLSTFRVRIFRFWACDFRPHWSKLQLSCHWTLKMFRSCVSFITSFKFRLRFGFLLFLFRLLRLQHTGCLYILSRIMFAAQNRNRWSSHQPLTWFPILNEPVASPTLRPIFLPHLAYWLGAKKG